MQLKKICALLCLQCGPGALYVGNMRSDSTIELALVGASQPLWHAVTQSTLLDETACRAVIATLPTLPERTAPALRAATQPLVSQERFTVAAAQRLLRTLYNLPQRQWDALPQAWQVGQYALVSTALRNGIVHLPTGELNPSSWGVLVTFLSYQKMLNPAIALPSWQYFRYPEISTVTNKRIGQCFAAALMAVNPEALQALLVQHQGIVGLHRDLFTPAAFHAPQHQDWLIVAPYIHPQYQPLSRLAPTPITCMWAWLGMQSALSPLAYARRQLEARKHNVWQCTCMLIEEIVIQQPGLPRPQRVQWQNQLITAVAAFQLELPTDLAALVYSFVHQPDAHWPTPSLLEIQCLQQIVHAQPFLDCADTRISNELTQGLQCYHTKRLQQLRTRSRFGITYYLARLALTWHAWLSWCRQHPEKAIQRWQGLPLLEAWGLASVCLLNQQRVPQLAYLGMFLSRIGEFWLWSGVWNKPWDKETTLVFYLSLRLVNLLMMGLCTLSFQQDSPQLLLQACWLLPFTLPLLVPTSAWWICVPCMINRVTWLQHPSFPY